MHNEKWQSWRERAALSQYLKCPDPVERVRLWREFVLLHAARPPAVVRAMEVRLGLR